MPELSPSRTPGPADGQDDVQAAFSGIRRLDVKRLDTKRLDIQRLDIQRLGLTGSIGAGKSTVAILLRARGLSVLDADAAARELSLTPEVMAEVSRQLGPEFVLQGGGLNRPALAALVFADPQKRGVLNGILHPRVREHMATQERQAASRGERWVVQDVPLLFEGEAWKGMDAILLVDAPLELRLERVATRGGLDREAARARDAAQMPIEQKRALLSTLPGAVLDNSGDLEHLELQLVQALRDLKVLDDQRP